MNVEQEVELSCTLRYGGFVLPNLQLFFNVHATVPSTVSLDDEVYIENGYAEIRIPPPTADALSITGADTVTGQADVFRLGLSNADPDSINLAVPPIPYGPQLVAPGVETTMRVPATGVLDPKGPITASSTAQVGDEIVTTLEAMDTVLRGTNSTNPTIDRTLPFNCVPNAAVSNVITSIPIVEDTPPPPPVPAVSSLNPTSGPAAGGNNVTITGTGLANATAVQFGSAAGTIVSNSDTQLVVRAPAGSGTVDVRVTTAGGQSANTNADNYTYIPTPPPAPAVTGLNPTSGPAAGGNQVTITGTNLGSATGVVFGSANATIVSNTGTQIVVTAPAGSGTVDVRVTTASGQSANTNADNYTYVPAPPPAPAVTSVNPTSGPAAGGNQVIINGTGFGDATSVTFGSAAATIVSRTATQLTVTAPAGSGTVDIRVSGPGGTSANTNADNYTYIATPPPAPAVTGLNPTSGPAAGGNQVTITGTNLGSATRVQFGTANATIVSNTATQIVVTAPAGTGTVDVRVTNANGQSANTNADNYTYQQAPPPPVPAVSGLNPNRGPAAGGNQVTITGTNLGSATRVQFGTANATIVSNTATQIVVTAPAGTGTVDVRVTTAAGQSANVAADNYTYEQPQTPGAAPTITRLLPNIALANIGGATIVTGTNLDTTTSVTIGGKAAQFVKVNKTTLLVALPALKAGTYQLVIKNPKGSSANNAASKVTYKSLF